MSLYTILIQTASFLFVFVSLLIDLGPIIVPRVFSSEGAHLCLQELEAWTMNWILATANDFFSHFRLCDCQPGFLIYASAGLQQQCSMATAVHLRISFSFLTHSISHVSAQPISTPNTSLIHGFVHDYAFQLQILPSMKVAVSKRAFIEWFTSLVMIHSSICFLLHVQTLAGVAMCHTRWTKFHNYRCPMNEWGRC